MEIKELKNRKYPLSWYFLGAIAHISAYMNAMSVVLKSIMFTYLAYLCITLKYCAKNVFGANYVMKHWGVKNLKTPMQRDLNAEIMI